MAAKENRNPTAILDFESPSVQSLVAVLKSPDKSSGSYLRSAHRQVVEKVRPVYTVDEFRPVSQVLSRGMGSCSQRMACLEALSRANSIATRVRGLWIDGAFWNKRFRWTAPFIPRKILLAWPQFELDSAWVDMDEIYGSAEELTKKAKSGFSNDGETLFEAVEHTSVDFLSKSRSCSCSKKFDLSDFVIKDEGFFDSRDQLFLRFGSLQYTLRGRVFEVLFGDKKSM